MLTRVVRAQEQLTNAWEVLKTMTPADYLQFRHAFGQASGFQSQGYRMVEFLLGNRHPTMLRPHAHRPDLHGPLNDALHAPSVYDLTLRCERHAVDTLAVSVFVLPGIALWPLQNATSEPESSPATCFPSTRGTVPVQANRAGSAKRKTGLPELIGPVTAGCVFCQA